MGNRISDSKIAEAIDQFKALDEKICHFSSMTSLIGWDQKVIAPKKGRNMYAKALGTLATEEFKLKVSDEMGHLLQVLSDPAAMNLLNDQEKAQLRERKAFFDRSKKIPTGMIKEFSILTSQANDAWEEARETNCFETYLPFLEKVIEFKKKAVEIYGYEKHPYDALLEEFEPGLTVEKLDLLFMKLREKSTDLLKRIQASNNKPNIQLFDQKFPTDKQKEFNRYILPIIGFDMEGGRLDETVHPFAQSINPGDVRITTRYLEDNVRSALFGTIHEAGHGIYEQNISPELAETVLQEGASFGIHESQSRFLENMIGRSESFWSYFFPKLQSVFSEQLREVELKDFYKAINAVQPSFIRVEADELTYNLHIMVRYEIEKGLITGEISAKDLPEIWNGKMEEYLGIKPESDTEGVLQDIHWSFGGLGYFPSYSLGNLYAAQLLNKVQKEIPDCFSSIEKGDFSIIQEWLKTNIHQYGKLYTPDELIMKATGESLNADYLIEYLENKYTQVYNL